MDPVTRRCQVKRQEWCGDIAFFHSIWSLASLWSSCSSFHLFSWVHMRSLRLNHPKVWKQRWSELLVKAKPIERLICSHVLSSMAVCCFLFSYIPFSLFFFGFEQCILWFSLLKLIIILSPLDGCTASLASVVEVDRHRGRVGIKLVGIHYSVDFSCRWKHSVGGMMGLCVTEPGRDWLSTTVVKIRGPSISC